jgi:hypothetical protein
MSATSSSTWANGSSGQSSWRSPAVMLGIGLIGVAKGFARSVLELGRVMNGAAARLKHEGGDPYSPNAGFNLVGVLSLLQHAVLLADALKARLRTAAVAIALARFGAARAGARNARPQSDEEPDAEDALWRIAYVRGDDRQQNAMRQAIAGMSDLEVVTHIHTSLLEASAMLGETDVAAEIRMLGCKAVALLGDLADAAAPGEVVPDGAASGDAASDTAATRPAGHGTPDEASDPDRPPAARPPPREVGRGPP